MTDPFQHLKSFRTYDGAFSSSQVASDLRAHFSPYIVVRSKSAPAPKHGFYVVKVDEEFFDLLDGSGSSLSDLLVLKKLPQARLELMDAGQSIRTALTSSGQFPGLPTVILDTDGLVRGLHAVEPGALPKPTKRSLLPPEPAGLPVTMAPSGPSPESLAPPAPTTSSASPMHTPDAPAADALVYPDIRALKGTTVDPGETLEYRLKLAASPPGGTSIPLLLQFPGGEDHLDIYAELSSREFRAVEGSPWTQRFRLNRKLDCSPPEWAFALRAVDKPLPQYSFTITFAAASQPIGAMTVTAARRSAMGAFALPAAGALPLALPVGTGARLVIKVTERPDQYSFTLFKDGAVVHSDIPWPIDAPAYFHHFENAAVVSDLDGLCESLWKDLPLPVRDFLGSTVGQGTPTLFLSNGRVAPFEFVRLNPDKAGPILGVDRPVVRWVHEWPIPDRSCLQVQSAACIRPQYPEPDDLPSAAEEESFLKHLFAGLPALRHKKEWSGLLERGEVRLVHFAGHAVGEPACLKLEDNDISPLDFRSGKDLFKKGSPFIFLNACKAGFARGTAPMFLGNMAKSLISSGCTGVVAPMVAIDSPAASKAAQVFYQAAETQTVAEAVRRVRELALQSGSTARQRTTFLSYTAFATPQLRLQFAKQRQ